MCDADILKMYDDYVIGLIYSIISKYNTPTHSTVRRLRNVLSTKFHDINHNIVCFIYYN